MKFVLNVISMIGVLVALGLGISLISDTGVDDCTRLGNLSSGIFYLITAVAMVWTMITNPIGGTEPS